MKDIAELALTDEGELLLKIELGEEDLKKITETYNGREHHSSLYVYTDGSISIFIAPELK